MDCCRHCRWHKRSADEYRCMNMYSDAYNFVTEAYETCSEFEQAYKSGKKNGKSETFEVVKDFEGIKLIYEKAEAAKKSRYYYKIEDCGNTIKITIAQRGQKKKALRRENG